MPFVKEAIQELRERSGKPLYKLVQQLDPDMPYSTFRKWIKGTATPRAENIDALYRLARKLGYNDIEFYKRP